MAFSNEIASILAGCHFLRNHQCVPFLTFLGCLYGSIWVPFSGNVPEKEPEHPYRVLNQCQRKLTTNGSQMAVGTTPEKLANGETERPTLNLIPDQPAIACVGRRSDSRRADEFRVLAGGMDHRIRACLLREEKSPDAVFGIHRQAEQRRHEEQGEDCRNQ